MDIAILSSENTRARYKLLEDKLNELIESSGCYLFYVLCGNLEGSEPRETLGELWAKKNGAPLHYISEKTTDRLLNKLFLKADYIIFFLDGNPLINNAFMRYKMMGKHGSIIRV